MLLWGKRRIRSKVNHASVHRQPRSIEGPIQNGSSRFRISFAPWLASFTSSMEQLTEFVSKSFVEGNQLSEIAHCSSKSLTGSDPASEPSPVHAAVISNLLSTMPPISGASPFSLYPLSLLGLTKQPSESNTISSPHMQQCGFFSSGVQPELSHSALFPHKFYLGSMVERFGELQQQFGRSSGHHLPIHHYATSSAMHHSASQRGPIMPLLIPSHSSVFFRHPSGDHLSRESLQSNQPSNLFHELGKEPREIATCTSAVF